MIGAKLIKNKDFRKKKHRKYFISQQNVVLLQYTEKVILNICNLYVSDLKIFKHIINIAVRTALVLVILVVVAVHIPAIQSSLGATVAQILADKLGTVVSVGHVDLGLFNRIVIDDVLIYDQQHKEMLNAKRITAKIDVLPLLDNKISISSAQIFGAKIVTYRSTAEDAPNFQFVIDSLASKDTTSRHQPLDLRINSFIMRHSMASWDEYDVAPTPGKLNVHHIKIKDISAHIVLKTLHEGDSINANIKKLAFKETSGLDVSKMQMHFEAGRYGARLYDFRLNLPNTSIYINDINAQYRLGNNKIIPATIQYEGAIENSIITPSDLTCLLPSLKSFSRPVAINAAFTGTSTNLRVARLAINSSERSMEMHANGWIRNWEVQPIWYANFSKLSMTQTFIDFIAQHIGDKGIVIPATIRRLGNIKLSGNMGGEGKALYTHCLLNTDAGEVKLNANIDSRRYFKGNISSKLLDIQLLTKDNRLGKTSAAIDFSGSLDAKGLNHLTAQCTVPNFYYNNYDYKGLNIKGSYNRNTITARVISNDPNLTINADGSMSNLNNPRKKIVLKANVACLNPQALHLSKKWGDARFAGDLNLNFTAANINDAQGELAIHNMTLAGTNHNYRMDNMLVMAGYIGKIHYVTLDSDFGSAQLTGQYDYGSLIQSFTSYIGNKLPTLPGLPPKRSTGNNEFALSAQILKTDWLQQLASIPLEIERPINISGTVSDRRKIIDIIGSAPAFTYNGNRYTNASIDITTPNDSMKCNILVTKIMGNNNPLNLELYANAASNNLSTRLRWRNEAQKKFYGDILAVSQFYKNSKGQSEAHIDIQPSRMLIADSAWRMEPATITYNASQLNINNFNIHHADQHLTINGTASHSENDSIIADLKDIDIEYVLNLVNFHSVDFSGEATGKAYLTKVFNNPDARAKLTVNHFKFEDGRMGVLSANVNWNKTDNQIDIDATANDGPLATTYIKGYVSPARNYIDLGIQARGTNIEFMRSFTSSFISKVDGSANGEVRLAGALSAINLTGKLVLNGEATVRPLNCTYQLRNDTVILIPNEIELHRIPIYDAYNHVAYMAGAIHHKNLTQLSYDLNVHADNFLGYDFKDFGDDTFYGTVFASGDVGIHGKSGEVRIDIDVTPEKNSTFIYNVTSPDAIANQEFIRWGDASAIDTLTITNSHNPEKNKDNHHNYYSGTNIYLNFLINCTPDATLKLLMDQSTDDYITLNGNGVIRATYYNKGSFNMFGTYAVDHGTYGLTIQNIIKKNFVFNPGGTIVFGGDPYNAAINLQAQYTVSGVSLSDLNIGNSFSNNTIRVNCLMNIKGKPSAPQIDFDMDMPTVNSDEKQLIRSFINSQQDMNQQVVYLLGIGRFYTQGNNNATAQEAGQQSQTSLAMQSLLSGTISSQLNNVLSSVINNNNWNIGANITTGDEGWNNAEYEGMLSGSLLNNRLLINGQFGYRDNAKTATSSFIGDFDIRYMLMPSGNLALKVYNQTNDRYFTKSSLNTQGLGLIMKKDFNGLKDLFRIKKKKTVKKQ